MISPSGCGVFGVLRKPHAPKIQGDSVVRSIDAVSYRGSDKGAGFAVFNLEEGNYYYLKAFFLDDPGKMRIAMESQGLQVIEESIEAEDRGYAVVAIRFPSGT